MASCEQHRTIAHVACLLATHHWRQQVAVQLQNPPAILMAPDDGPALLMSKIVFLCLLFLVDGPSTFDPECTGQWAWHVTLALQLPPPQTYAAVEITIPLSVTLTRVYLITPHLHVKQMLQYHTAATVVLIVHLGCCRV